MLPQGRGSCARTPPGAEGAVPGLPMAHRAVPGLPGVEDLPVLTQRQSDQCWGPLGKREAVLGLPQGRRSCARAPRGMGAVLWSPRWQQDSPDDALQRTLWCHQLPTHCQCGMLSAFPGSTTGPWVPTLGASKSQAPWEGLKLGCWTDCPQSPVHSLLRWGVSTYRCCAKATAGLRGPTAPF